MPPRGGGGASAPFGHVPRGGPWAPAGRHAPGASGVVLRSSEAPGDRPFRRPLVPRHGETLRTLPHEGVADPRPDPGQAHGGTPRAPSRRGPRIDGSALW